VISEAVAVLERVKVVVVFLVVGVVMYFLAEVVAVIMA
jgi:hypothetical protein